MNSRMLRPKIEIKTEFNKCKIDIKLNAPGIKSYIAIQSFDVSNNSKTYGGDFWWMKVKGPTSFNVPLIDNDTGFYYQEFWLNSEGSYEVTLMLEFSKYDGLKDPPKDWFKYGDYQGRRQNEDYFGRNFDFILELKTFKFSVLNSNLQNKKDLLQSWHFQPFCVANKAHGYWENNVYVSVNAKTDSIPKHKLILQNLATKSNSNAKPTLWMYGDSLTLRFFNYMTTTQLCMFFTCQRTYTWTYPLTNENPNDQPFDNKDFDQAEFLNHIKMVLLSPSMLNNNSVLVINFGLHILKNINMSQAEKLMDGFVDMILDLKLQYLSGFPKIIWKSTTPAYVEYIINTYGITNLERYLNKQRAILWNSYCIKILCKENIPVLDIYWMAASYPEGAKDAVHYDDNVFSSAAMFLIQTLS